MAKLFVFRHAQTTDNKDGIFSGRRDPDLTPQGLEEAKKIRDELKKEKVTKAFCAPNKRTKHTLEIVLEPHGGTEVVVADPRIRERDYGDLTGKSKKKTAELYPKEYPAWHRGYDTPPPGGESLKQVEERVLEFLKELLQNVWQNDVIFICASGNSLRPIRRYFEKMTQLQMSSFEHERAKIYKYEV
ncbi:MAG: histidine phosphatase family protein [Candidatus Levybacteria bacterium]|nr:histidine phosphatase family protein [Candidatus Levybacteria bacterium]